VIAELLVEFDRPTGEGEMFKNADTKTIRNKGDKEET